MGLVLIGWSGIYFAALSSIGESVGGAGRGKTHPSSCYPFRHQSRLIYEWQRVPFDIFIALTISFEKLSGLQNIVTYRPFVTKWSLIENIHIQRRHSKNVIKLCDYVSLMWERRSEQPFFWMALKASLINIIIKIELVVSEA